jgi:hypothetical protein
MTITLSVADTRRWLAGDPDALAVEQAIMRWAKEKGIREAVVVFTASGLRAFAFRLPLEPEGEEEP